jgi:hypothetical protein
LGTANIKVTDNLHHLELAVLHRVVSFLEGIFWSYYATVASVGVI